MEEREREEKKKTEVPNSENPKVIILLFETVKFLVPILPRNFYISVKSMKKRRCTIL